VLHYLFFIIYKNNYICKNHWRLFINKARYYQRNLPHYYIPNACYFITFRLCDSIPCKKIEKYKRNYHRKKSKLKSKNLNKSQKLNIIWKKYFYKVDKILHQNKQASVYLKNPKVAQQIASSLKYYDGEDYKLICYCIMPNHVHTIFTLKENARKLEKILFSIKRYTAGQANKILNREGQFWQHESYDHIVRNEESLWKIVYYILNNPVEAGLVSDWEDWEWNYLKKMDI